MRHKNKVNENKVLSYHEALRFLQNMIQNNEKFVSIMWNLQTLYHIKNIWQARYANLIIYPLHKSYYAIHQDSCIFRIKIQYWLGNLRVWYRKAPYMNTFFISDKLLLISFQNSPLFCPKHINIIISITNTNGGLNLYFPLENKDNRG